MICVNGISKSYGPLIALDDISFNVEKGDVMGLLGPNGAGKSTVMKILSCYINSDKGKASIFGEEVYVGNIDACKNIGYLPENNPIYLDITVADYLELMGGVKGISAKNMNKHISKVATQCHIHDKLNARIDTLSKGYKQRTGLAGSIISEPKVLILDEPTTGLDPSQIIDIRNLIKELSENIIIILSTHIMQEVEQTCNRIVIMDKGQMVIDKKVKDIFGMGGSYTIQTKKEIPIEDFNHIGKATKQGEKISIITHSSIEELATFLQNRGELILELKHNESSMEDMFLQAIGDRL